MLITTKIDLMYKEERMLSIELRPCEETNRYPYIKDVFITYKTTNKNNLNFLRNFIRFSHGMHGITLVKSESAFDEGNLGYSTQDEMELVLNRLPEGWNYIVSNPDSDKEPFIPGVIY
jgi:hypothetical protein